MDCNEVHHFLIDYRDGELATGLLIDFEKHIMTCKSCSKLLKNYQQMAVVIDAEKRLEPNPFAATRILQYLENKQERRSKLALAVLRPVLITMALFLALLTGYLVGSMGVARNAVAAKSNSQIEILKADLYIQDFVDEDLALLTNY